MISKADVTLQHEFLVAWLFFLYPARDLDAQSPRHAELHDRVLAQLLGVVKSFVVLDPLNGNAISYFIAD